MQITFHIPHSENWSAQAKEDWFKENVLNPAIVAHSELAVNFLETDAPEKAKSSHGVARQILLAQLSV